MNPDTAATARYTAKAVATVAAALVFGPQVWMKAETSSGQIQFSTDLATWTNVSSPYYTNQTRAFFRATY